jgi:hypothetical protein
MNRRRRSSARPGSTHDTDVLAFWGLPGVAAGAPSPPGGAEAGPGALIRPTSDPGAVPRSLGDPPLPVRPGVAAAHLAAVYEEAVRTATALAAVNGLLAPDLDEDPED